MKEYISLGKIIKTYNDFGVVRAQVQPVMSTEVETVALLNDWGSNSNPLEGSPCIILMVDCEPTKKYAVPFNLNDAIKIASGEKIIYNSNGTKIHLKQNGDIDIQATDDNKQPNINITASTNVNINATNVSITATDSTLNGNVTIDGNLEVTGDSTLTGTGTTIAGKNFLSHTHSGVTTGAGVTGGVV